jgi:DNA-binding IclR family transcriptional regulator
MRNNGGGEPAKNGLPVIDRVSDMLDLLERRPAGVTIRELAQSLLLPRTSVYRSLNTLEAHGIVRRSPAGAYTLGPRLLGLAAQVVVDRDEEDLAALALPHLEQLSLTTGEASKLSILADDRALVIAVAQSSGSVGVAVVAGRSFPLHAGGASKLLLAHLPADQIERVTQAQLPGLTRRTVTDPTVLSHELDEIRRRGYARDRGEYSTSVYALAAPVRDGSGQVVAALSIPFLADADARRQVRLRAALLAEAARLSASLAAAGARPGLARSAPARPAA